MDQEMLLLFEHTSQGNKALRELDEAGVTHEAVRVVGDLGAPVSQPGAEQHVTLDWLHVPDEERQIFMDTIRGGGAVLAIDTSLVAPDFVQRLGEKHGAMRMSHTSASMPDPSHNAAP